ncbi:transglycosylase SLT domain-containing protein [Tahibacter amnicola]|uniref:Transglycosylase SLT domain-containing protein n=1 Tax=Tahibacter amnicola TaxID=2976241 RepID=A0ABY6BHZ7_9GAMM|nr:transglycosylase SLT domain-containing protein [Tahibacter amnicola]UXI69619.1 transglycosylase SLT domain-containing protein [Tahibacter amnicola]
MVKFARIWRHGLVATLAVTLAACASAPHRDLVAVEAGSMPMPPLDLRLAPEDSKVPLAPVPDVTSTPALAVRPGNSPWERLRTRLSMPGCEYSPQVQRWARTYTQGPDRFAATLKRSLPFLMLVLDELERQDLPGEFALLPYLESHYEPIPARGDTPAGMWQMVPGTARSMGLKVSPSYDGRLDPWASSMAAVGLLKKYQDQFGDWRLVDMAFNAGEQRVRQLLRKNAETLSSDQLAKLKLSPITHEHLAKLLALGCVVNDPARFGVTLPEPEPDDHLVRVPLSAPIDIRVAARLADVEENVLKRYNAGHRQSRMASDAPMHLLLPQTAAATFQQRYEQLSPAAWSTWEAVKLREPRGVSELAGQAAVPIDLVSIANGVDTSRDFAAGATVFLPSALGRSVGTAPPAPSIPLAPGATEPTPEQQTIVIRSGDTLWDLAKKHKVSIGDLKRWNRLGERESLKPGQKLRVGASD